MEATSASPAIVQTQQKQKQKNKKPPVQTVAPLSLSELMVTCLEEQMTVLSKQLALWKSNAVVNLVNSTVAVKVENSTLEAGTKKQGQRMKINRSNISILQISA